MQTPEEFLALVQGYNHDCAECVMPDFAEGINIVRDRDAEIKRECAERAQDEWEQLFCDDMIDDREFVTKKLRAAITGEEVEG